MKRHRYFVISLLILMHALSMHGQITIISDDPNYTTGEESAVLDVKSQGKGILIPRMTLQERNAINLPATGLLVFQIDTEPGFYYNAGTKTNPLWKKIHFEKGNNAGDMLYWDGNTYQVIPAGTYGQRLVFCNGAPVWGGCLPMVTTSNATAITSNSAVVGGVIVNDGGDKITLRGVCWNTSPNPTTSHSVAISHCPLDEFGIALKNLQPSTTYYARAFATNTAGLSYGNEIMFTTSENQPFVCGTSMITDQDGNEYPTVQIGNQCWMKTNLNVGVFICTGMAQDTPDIVQKYCYDNQPSNCEIYGGLYQWDQAMNYNTNTINQGICPEGWRLPTEDDINILLTTVGSSSSCKLRTVGPTYWDNNSCATDAFGFSARGAGTVNTLNQSSGIKANTVFWTTKVSNYNPVGLRISNSSTSASTPSYGRTSAHSIRCIKE